MDPGMPMAPTPPGGMAPGGGMGHNGGPPMDQQQQVWLVPPGAKQERATRIGEHMSWQCLEEMKSWETDTDKMLHILPIVGCCFRKTYYDPSVRHNASVLVLADNLIVNYAAKDMETVPRQTERIEFYPNEIEEQIRAGLFIDQVYQKSSDAGDDDDAPIEFLEQHRWLDLDDDGYNEPYIVTVHKQSSKVARVVARYDVDGIKFDQREGRVVQIEPVHYYTKYDFLPNPDGGIYGLGFGQLLAPVNESVNTALNQLFDAGSLANTGGGFIGRGMSLHSGALTFKMGEWKQINTPGSALKDSIVPFNHPGPSPVLFQLLGLLIEAGKEIASIKDVLTGENAAATMQPTTLMALIEQGLTQFASIFKRVHLSLKKELQKLYRLNRIYMEDEAQYQVGDEWRAVSREDYERGAGVTPYSDPTMVSDMQRMAKAQFLQSYQNDPNVNRIEVIKRVMDAAQIDDVDKLIVEQTPPNPAVLAATAELELKHREADTKDASAKAAQIKDISQAYLNLAKADEANATEPLEQTAQYIKLIELQLQALLAPAEGRGQSNDGQSAAAPMPIPPPLDPMPFMGANPGMLQ